MTKNINEFFEIQPPEVITFEQDAYDNLPKFLKSIVNKFEKQNEKDIALLSALTAISGLSVNYYGKYDRRTIEPNLYSFIVAPFGSGKGMLCFIRLLIHATDKEKTEAYNNALQGYRTEKRQGRQPEPPKRKVLIIPANTTKTQFLKILSENEGKITIFETEADTLTTALFGKYGEFSDVMRCGFQGEPTSYTRATDDVLIKIDSTTITVLISGTLNQVLRLIKDYADGLASRFDFLYMLANAEFKDVFGENDDDFENWFKQRGAELAEMYRELHDREDSNLLFSFTSQQQDCFREHWAGTKKIYHEEYSGEMDGVVNRQALKCAKMAMTLSLIRTYFSGKIKTMPDEIVCSDDDFICALSLSTTLLKSNMLIADSIMKGAAPGKSNFLQKIQDEAAQKETVIRLWDEGIHSCAELARRIGRPVSDRPTIRKWLIKAGRIKAKS